MDEDEFAIRETARSFEIDLDGHRVTYQFASEEEQLALNVDVEGWTPEALVLWLDRQARQPDIRQSELIRWLRDLAGHLIDVRGMHISALMRGKFLLARKIRNKIEAIRRKERETVYQRYLFTPEARIEVSFEHAFTFRKDMYRDQRRYRGRWRPRRHFLGADRVPAFDGVEDGEEFPVRSGHRQPAGAPVLDSQRSARSGFFFAADRDGSVLSRLCRATRRRAPSRRRIQGCTRCGRSGYPREAGHR